MSYSTNQVKPKAYPITGVPRNQALNSKTFHLPPLDGSLTIPELWDWQAEHSPNHPVFVYTDDDGTEKTLYWPELAQGIHRAGWMDRSGLPEKLESKPVIAILAASDSITYFLVEAGIQRADCIMFPISPRNSPAAVAHLLGKTKATHVLIGPEPNMQKLAASAFKIMGEGGTQLPSTSTMPVYGDLMKPQLDSDFKYLPSIHPRLDEYSNILHSSGSTAFPKPIMGWHHRFLIIGLTPFFGAHDLCGVRIGIHSIPMYHGMGAVLLAWTATCGAIVCTFKPRSPAVSPSPENTLTAVVSDKCEVAFCVPSFVENWAKRPEDVQTMKRLKGILFGGGPMAKHVGDKLAAEGIALYTLYGATEAGLMHQIIPDNPGKDWEYMNFNVPAVRLHWIHQGDGTAELVILPSSLNSPAVINTVVDGEDAYATSDLFIPHPTKPGYWKLFGRTDDQIMHNTGEKTNPGPLESILNQDPHVERCVMFGRGRFSSGVLIDPKPADKFDPADTQKLAAFRNKIWPTIEKMNEYAPQHSRLFKEMILVTSPSKPFTYTAKSTPRRQAIVNEYEPEIEALYVAAAESTQADDLTPPSTWDLLSTIEFVRTVVGRVVNASLSNTEDMFQRGCDSLQATWIRNSILHALRESTEVDTRSISASFVYQYPTIASLAEYLSSLSTAKPQTNGHVNGHGDSQAQTTVSAMLNMTASYCGDWPKHKPTVNIPQKDTILVTGTTGSLGAGLLARLVQTPGIEHIYTFNRMNDEGKNLLERQKERLLEWGFDPNIATLPKVTFVEANMSADRLGLSPETYDKIRTSITHIIHNGYRVNFNLSLTSFEPNVKTVRHLIDLCLSSPHSSPPKLLFVSSIGVLGHHERGSPIKEAPIDPSSAIASGYTQSKWVNEQLLSIAEKETPLRPVTIRLGQVAGSTTGAWNRAEWFPTLVVSGAYLRCLPQIDRDISWIPVDAVAQAIIEMRNSPYAFLHLAHPRPVPWSTIINPIAKSLGVPLIPYNDWITRLEKSGENLDAQSEVEMMKVNPALRILDFFSRSRGAEGIASKEAMGLPDMDMSNAEEVAPALSPKNLPQLSEKDALNWLAYW